MSALAQPNLVDVTVEVTPEIIQKAVAFNPKDCLLYHAIKPMLSENASHFLSVGVSIFHIGYGEDTYTGVLPPIVATYISNALSKGRSSIEPATFTIQIPEQYVKQ